MNKSEQINELAAALSKAQSKIESADKSAKNYYDSSYANLPSVWEACREALTSNGLSVVQCTDTSENGMTLETVLLHSSGQWISSLYPVEPTKRDPQGYGSALTYSRRYALMALVGVVADDASDDDGNAASDKSVPDLGPQYNDEPKQPSRREHFKQEGMEAAKAGLGSLKKWWDGLQMSEQRTLAVYKDTILKPIAEGADKEAA